MRAIFGKCGSIPITRIILIAFLLNSCDSVTSTLTNTTPTPWIFATSSSLISATGENVLASLPTATTTSTPQPTAAPVVFGPNQEDFPPDVNPLTGLSVADPTLLKQPALLISIPHFPSEARPQAGLSFSPWVFEYMIAVGTTRFLAVFYSRFPFQEVPVTGGCDVRTEPFVQTGLILGNRVWLDKNADGIQQPYEPGVGGVCINLCDTDGHLVQRTTTDSNGYFGFNVVMNAAYKIEFVRPEGMSFTLQNIGYENLDSDADPVSGFTDLVTITADDRLRDAGLLLPDTATPVVNDEPIAGQVGPVRSARLVNIHIHDFFQDSCLVFAGVTDEILDKVPPCALVFKEGDGGIGSMLDISRMIKISEENGARRGSDFDYASNVFSDQVPSVGQPVTQIDVFFSQLNQSRWVYDPLYQGWLRYVDNASKDTVFHVDTDRLTGRQLFFENVIVLFTDHEVIEPTIIDIYLQQGERGDGLLFRDAQLLKLKWSTLSGEYEKKTGFRRPIALLDEKDNPIPLRPGRTWILIVTPFSDVSEKTPGVWRLRFYPPPGAGLY